MNNNLDNIIRENKYDTERSLLGCLMLESKAIIDVIDTINPESFELLEHQYIYQSIVDLYNDNIEIDIITLGKSLADKKQFGLIGNEYLSHLVNLVPVASHIKSYGQIIAGESTKREIAKIAEGVIKKATQGKHTVQAVIEYFENELFNLSTTMKTTEVIRLRAVLDEVYATLGEDIDLRGIPTGFNTLDNFIGGFNKSDLIILAARPSMGKSALALNFATSAMRQEKVVLFFSLEMGKSDLADRLVSTEAGIDSWLLRTNKLNAVQISQARDAIEKLKPFPLFLESTADVSITEIKTAAKRLKLKSGLDLLVVDYLGLVQMSDNKNKVNQVADITRGLKILAKELDIPIILLCQLSRACEMRDVKNKRPKLIDLRDSGAIEQDADIVLMMYRDSYYKTIARDQPDITELNIAKNRNGVSGRTVKLSFNPRLQHYTEWQPADKRFVENTKLID